MITGAMSINTSSNTLTYRTFIKNSKKILHTKVLPIVGLFLVEADMKNQLSTQYNAQEQIHNVLHIDENKDIEIHKIQSDFEIYNAMDVLLDHTNPLASNLFARGSRDTVNTVALQLLDNFRLYQQHIQHIQPKSIIIPGVGDVSGGRTLIESGLQARAGLLPKQKEIHVRRAVGYRQFILSTRNLWHQKTYQSDPKITPLRSDPYSNIKVSEAYFDHLLQETGNVTYALWAYHAGEGRLKYNNPRSYPNIYQDITGISRNETNVLERYQQILPWKLVDKFMSLNDNSFIYVAQIIAAQGVYNVLQQDPQKIQHIISEYQIHQTTKVKGAGIEDIRHKNTQLQAQPYDQQLIQLFEHIQNLTNTKLEVFSQEKAQLLHEQGHVDSPLRSVIMGKAMKILVPFARRDDLRTSTSTQGLIYKRIRYLCELMRIHGLCSFAIEKLPTGELVFHLGINPNIKQRELDRFISLHNWNH